MGVPFSVGGTGKEWGGGGGGLGGGKTKNHSQVERGQRGFQLGEGKRLPKKQRAFYPERKFLPFVGGGGGKSKLRSNRKRKAKGLAGGKLRGEKKGVLQAKGFLGRGRFRAGGKREFVPEKNGGRTEKHQEGEKRVFGGRGWETGGGFARKKRRGGVAKRKKVMKKKREVAVVG